MCATRGKTIPDADDSKFPIQSNPPALLLAGRSVCYLSQRLPDYCTAQHSEHREKRCKIRRAACARGGEWFALANDVAVVVNDVVDDTRW